MDALPPSPQPFQSSPTAASASSEALTQNDEPPAAAAGHPTSNDSNPTVETETPPRSRSTINRGKAVIIKKKKKKRPPTDVSDPPPTPPSSSSSCCTSLPVQRGLRVSNSRRNPRILICSVRQKESDVEALALPLGMSIAAVLAQVLERKDAAGERMPVDHLSSICTLAVRESLANVFGDRFDCFVRNFEKSFRSTLMTLRLINESSQSKGEHLRPLNKKSNCSDVASPMSFNGGDSAFNSGAEDCQSEAVPHSIQEQLDTLEETGENMRTGLTNRELALHDGQMNQLLTCVSSSTQRSVINQSMLTTLEKSVMEQARSNDLKTFEMGLIMKKLQLKETQLSLNSDSNLLERCKLSMGVSKASFKAEKFKNELEDTRHAELLKMCIDCLVAGLLVMLGCLAYGTYVYSHKRITEATASCTPTMESKSWWIPKPMASFNSGLQVLRCQVQVISRMLFGVLMILAIAYLLLQRSATSKQTMPVTFILLLLGVACGFAGKLCIDTLGGSGYHWLFYWEALCLFHFFSNVCTSALFLFLHGPITVSQGARGNTIFPYWIRRSLFYATALLFLPLLCGFVPFASPGEWKDHFSSLVIDFLPITND
uniref:Protein CPR-5-like n=1 Tax=Davidia involucrata TaxID=16924 RepID=A0A5B7C7D2_DAVIN